MSTRRRWSRVVGSAHETGAASWCDASTSTPRARTRSGFDGGRPSALVERNVQYPGWFSAVDGHGEEQNQAVALTVPMGSVGCGRRER
jgi:hypothetical protein